MVHPVGFAGYGFSGSGGDVPKRAKAQGLASIRSSLLGGLLFRVRQPQSELGEGHGQTDDEASGRSGCAPILWAWRL
jgi:hypothetical protein